MNGLPIRSEIEMGVGLNGKESGPPTESGFRFVYVVEQDLSIDDGPGINERELIDEFTRSYAEEILCIAPRPRFPARHFNPHIEYVLPHHGNILRYPLYLISAYFRLLRICRDFEPQAVVFRVGASPLVPFLTARTTGLPIILKKLSLYAIFGQSILRSKIKNAISKSFLPVYRSVIRSSLGADVESRNYPAWLNEHFGIPLDRMVVIPNGVNTKQFRPKDRRRKNCPFDLEGFDYVVGYVGALSRLRNVDSIIRAVAEIQDLGRAGLVIVGEGPDEKYLERLTRELGLQGNVLFVGQIPYRKVAAFIGSFDVGVDLTAVKMQLEDGEVIASYSQKIPQYLACGVPVLAWRCADTTFLEDEGVGYLACYEDERGIAAGLTMLLSLPAEQRQMMRERARSVAERRYAVPALAERRVAYWRLLVSGQARQR